ncbi:tail fiber assembly protein [Aeromonas hydrophila]|uniref:tail fiber assembly protein n=1 Tax=Aeromonas hydrophila TaxID=644 RepID=UPI003F796954
MKNVFYSKSLLGFIFDTSVADAVEVPYDEYQRLLESQAEGFQIVPDKNGYPKLVAQSQPSVEERAIREQSMRISEANQQIAILKPAVDGGYAKQEHTQLLADWQRYRYELTLVPEQAGWPVSHQLPERPASVI